MTPGLWADVTADLAFTTNFDNTAKTFDILTTDKSYAGLTALNFRYSFTDDGLTP